MNFQTMSKQRKFVLIAALAGVIGMFLPWYSFSIFGASGSINGMHGNGILVFICFAVAGVMAYLGDQTKNLTSTSWIVTLICGAIAVLIVVWNIFKSSDYGLGSSMTFGIYLAALAAVGVVAAAFLFRSPEDNIKSGFDSLKKDIGTKMNNPNNPNSDNTGNTNPPL
jgi:crotonobetainyl-CoA:carnitine CoA-transferase CaiB-like acyl-CoA transferase